MWCFTDSKHKYKQVWFFGFTRHLLVVHLLDRRGLVFDSTIRRLKPCEALESAPLHAAVGALGAFPSLDYHTQHKTFFNPPCKSLITWGSHHISHHQKAMKSVGNIWIMCRELMLYSMPTFPVYQYIKPRPSHVADPIHRPATSYMFQVWSVSSSNNHVRLGWPSSMFF